VTVALFLVASLLGSRTASAQSVVLVRPPEADRVLVEAFNRLRAELGLQSFEVVVVEAPEGPSTPEAVERLAQEKSAFAAISFTRRADTTTADVWIADRATGKTTVRTLALRGVADAPSVLAVRAVDLLRESLHELGPEAPPPEVANVDRRPVSEAVRAWAEPPRPPWRLRLEGTLLGELTGLTPAYGGGIADARRLSERVSLGLAFAGPLVGGTYEASTGTATTHQELGWVELGVTAYQNSVVELGGTLGAGVYHLTARSEQVKPPLASTSDDVVSALGSLGVLASLHASEGVALSAGFSALLLTPRPAVAVGPEQTDFSEPLFRASLGMEVDF
jgi:hypothetical protein